MKDVFFFDSMLTPKIITFIYWGMLLFVLVGGLGSIFSGGVIAGLGILIGGAVGSRIWCELLIVLFKINENIKGMAEK